MSKPFQKHRASAEWLMARPVRAVAARVVTRSFIRGCPLVLISLPPASTEVAAGQFAPCRKTRIAPGVPKGNETVTDTFLGRKLAPPLPPGARRAGEVASRSGHPASPWGSEVGEVRGTGRPRRLFVARLPCCAVPALLFRLI